MMQDRRSYEQWARDCARSLDDSRARRERDVHPFPSRAQHWLVALLVVLVLVVMGAALAGVDLR